MILVKRRYTPARIIKKIWKSCALRVIEELQSNNGQMGYLLMSGKQGNHGNQEPLLGEVRIIDVRRNGRKSSDLEVYNGSKWVSFDEFAKSKKVDDGQ